MAAANPRAGLNRAARRRARIAGLSLLATTGLAATYVGYIRMPKAYAATQCGSDVTTEAELTTAINDFLTTACDTITITSSITLTSSMTPIIAGSLLDKSLTIEGGADGVVIDGSDTHRGIRFEMINSGNSLTVRNLEFKDLRVDPSDTQHGGGAIWVLANEVDLIVEDCTFTGNEASPVGTGSSEAGGAIVNSQGAIEVRDSLFTGNFALDGGGAIDARDGLVVENSVFIGNYSGDRGTESGDGFGGAISARYVTIADSYFKDNSAEYAGAINQYAFYGIYGSLTITNSTFVSNEATQASGAVSSNQIASNPAVITNSTFTGNSAGTDGGALSLYAAKVNFTTIVGNTAAGNGGGIANGTAIEISNSILFNTADGSGDDTWSYADPSGVAVDPAFSSFTSAASSVPAFTNDGSTIFGNPKLGAVGDNGGFTLPNGKAIPTMKPLAGSPVINAANTTTTGFPSTDQRGKGYQRVIDGRADMGAVEARLALTVKASPATQSKRFGQAIADGYTVTGFRSGDGFTTKPTCRVYTRGANPKVVKAPVPVGSYDLMCAGGVAPAYYEVTYVDGKVTVTKAATTTAYDGTSGDIKPGDRLDLSATVTPAACDGPVTYRVTEPDGTSRTITSGTSTKDWKGTYTIKASYAGDANCAASSDTATIEVSAGGSGKQKPITPLSLPKELKAGQWNTIVPSAVITNAGQKARVRVLCTPLLRSGLPGGDLTKPCEVRRGGRHVEVRPASGRSLQVVVRLYAPAVNGYSSYKKVVSYTLRG